jgi:hypothetical protein
MYLGFDFGFPFERGALDTTEDVDIALAPLCGAFSARSLSVELGGVEWLEDCEDTAFFEERHLLREWWLFACDEDNGGVSFTITAIGDGAGSPTGSCGTLSKSSTISVTWLRAMMCERTDFSLRGTEITLTGTSPLSEILSCSSCNTFRQ